MAKNIRYCCIQSVRLNSFTFFTVFAPLFQLISSMKDTSFEMVKVFNEGCFLISNKRGS